MYSSERWLAKIGPSTGVDHNNLLRNQIYDPAQLLFILVELGVCILDVTADRLSWISGCSHAGHSSAVRVRSTPRA